MALISRGQITVSVVEDGASSVNIFFRSHSEPSTPVGDSPTGWSADSDSFASSYGILWVSNGMINSDGTLNGDWSKPVMYEPYNSNLLWNFPWSEGSGSLSVYSQSGSPNYREEYETPFGYKDIVWRGVSEGNKDADGGFNAYNCTIDHTKAYRMSCWFKRTSMDGSSYLGANGTSNSVQVYSGGEWVTKTNFYFWSGDLPEINKWYLLVGYMYGSGETKTEADTRAGIYDPETGKQVVSFSTISRNYPGVTNNGIRAYHYYCSVADISAYFWSPRVDLLDGREPSIEEILKKSQDGEDGEAGRSVTSTDVEYAQSSSATTAPTTGWQTTSPTWVNGSYIWQRVKTIFSTGEINYSPAVNVTGQQGDEGRGVVSITEQYYLSTSKESLAGGSWSDTTYTWSSGKYIWTRSKITYSSGTPLIAYTDPYCDSSWEAVNEIQIGIKNLLQDSYPSTSFYGGPSKYNIFSIKNDGLSYIETGKTYTITAKLKVSEDYPYPNNGGSKGIGFWISGLASLNSGKCYSNTEWQVIQQTFTATMNGYLSAYHYTSGTEGTSYIEWVTLVEGNMAPMVWIEADDDFNDRIAEAKAVADAITEKAASEGWATKLTYIDSTGIFTGQLSANTVTAIQINASQITAGTIDAARINTESLKSTLITASNINALTLDVVKGNIGGWAIASGSISAGNLVISSASKRVVVYSAAGSISSGQRTQIYYNSDTDYGIYSTDSGGSIVFRLGSVNSIAGWGLTTSTISKGSVILGSDGSIYNTSNKWKLANDGSGLVASGNISWDTSGNVTFGSSVSLNWTAPISDIQDDIEANVNPKITKLTSTGIYTGTLTATQVNAVAISASSITTGTLSADRIAAGSITAAKLNASSIQSDIINASYINGLTCTFAKGTIGGWSINSGNMTSGQISLNSASNRIAVYGSTSSSTSGHRVQFYYSSDSSFGFYATNSSGTCIAQLGSANQIAGWQITSSAIYKNSVYLGSDGSIYNGTKWQLNNDGSGSIASGNISWDSAGAVTFSSAVSLQWQADIETAKASNFGYAYYQSIVVYGEDDVYYPVVFKGGDQNMKREILIRRSYAEQAPSTWYSSTHKGGLIALLKANFGGWGGIGYSWEIYDLSETYCRMFAGAQHCGNSCMFAIFLRGGGTTGAKYHLYSDQAIVSSTYSPDPIPAAPQIAYDSDLIFSTGSTLAYAPAPRTLTDAVEDEIRSKRFIYLAQTSDSTLQDHPLTYIGSTGIYTGTLTANQVNAVAISATSITTGTLSADRIAAGSIYATKLNAASIQSDIINATYINGLTCTFTKGTIGGWSIASGILSSGQLALNATSKRIAVYGASSSTTTGHRVQLFYTSDTSFGFYATNSSGSCIAQLGSSNQISGWQITSSYIYKNSVYLGSDGSVYNSASKWRLANDGSGYIASGNISWDASGNVSFASSVALNWTTLINQGKLYVRGTGYNNAGNRLVILNGTTVVNNSSRGLSVTVINRDTLAFESTTNYDVYSSETYCTTMATHLDSLSSDKIVVITSCDAIRINATLNTAIQRCGGNDYTVTNQRYPYALIGIPTIGKNNGIIVLYGSDATEPHAEISTNIESGIPIGINTNGKLLTNISGTGIYTGTLTADQITAGTINAARIDTASIKTAILTATNVNALTLTTTKGTIGGWNISSSYIYKNTVYFGSDGSIYNSTKWKLNYDGSGQLANGNISWDTSGSITAKNAIFTNVRVQGSVRNPFVLNDSSIWVGGDSSDQTNFNNYDNIVAVNTSSWASYIPLPWTLENSGRRITLVNYKWSTTTSTGYMSISAPTGQYFYEDGIAKSAISFSRECIELLGYGDSSTFYGWIVLNRINLMTTSCYGKNLRVLAFGKVTGTASSASITYTTFDNTTMSVSRMSQGKYRVAFSSTWGLSSSNALIMLTGYGYAVESSTAPIKASLYAIYTSSFYVQTSDDSSGNDGSFYFQITNMNDWTY